MPVARLAAVLAAALALAAPAHAAAPAPPAPTELKAFLLRADEPEAHTFSRTPAFSWTPVTGAAHYELELATSPLFNEGSVVWSDRALKTPAASIPIALPWMTGKPYALYAHVRAVTRERLSQWSSPFGFNMTWSTVPGSVPTYPGLVRWTVVPGATGYHVWFVDAQKVIATKTNVADEREYYTFHQRSPWPDVVRWRVRAVRTIYGQLPNGLPAVSYGPWSPIYTSLNPPLATGPLVDKAAISDIKGTARKPVAHSLTPGFAFSGNAGLDGTEAELYRVYVFSDQSCVNVVFRGAVVGSPAYAPRSTGPLALPPDVNTLGLARSTYLPDGSEGATFLADTSRVQTTESDKPPTAPSDAGSGTGTGSGSSTGTGSGSGTGSTSGTGSGTDAGSGSGAGSGTGTSSATGSSASSGNQPAGGTGTGSASSSAIQPPITDPLALPSTPKVTGAPIDLWDSGWPNGRYYWTVVGVRIVNPPIQATTLAAPAGAGATTLTVGSTSGLVAGSVLRLGSGPSRESVGVASVTDSSTIALGSGLRFAHTPGEPLATSGTSVEYQDVDLPQDACAAGRVFAFGKSSPPALAATSTPYVSGLAPSGRLVAAVGQRPSFYGAPLVAWQPALGADEYELQWSPTRYPWQPAGRQLTFSTSALLTLAPGTWYYRVRGLDFSLPGTARAMSWSDPVQLVLAKPTFRIVPPPAVTAETAPAALAKPAAPARPAAPAKPEAPAMVPLRPPAPGAPGGFKLWAAPNEGFSLALPRSWLKLSKADPRLAADDKAGFKLRLFAYDPRPDGLIRADLTVHAGAGDERPFAAWSKEAIASAQAVPGQTTPVSSSTVSLAGQQALRLAYSYRRSDGMQIAVVQYVLATPAKRYVLSFFSEAADAAAYGPVFATAARTFSLAF